MNVPYLWIDTLVQPEGLMARLHQESIVAEELPEQPEMPLGQLFMPIVLLIGMSFILMSDGLRVSMAGLAGGVLATAFPFPALSFVPPFFLFFSSLYLLRESI